MKIILNLETAALNVSIELFIEPCKLVLVSDSTVMQGKYSNHRQ